MLNHKQPHLSERDTALRSMAGPSVSNPQITTTIPVVCGLDDGYVMPLATMMHSVLEHLSEHCQIQLFVIDAGIQPENRAKIAASFQNTPCQLHWITPPQAVVATMQTMMVSAHITAAAYYRLLMAELLPPELDKVIYLDCDLMVMTDLQRLWQQDLQSYHLLAVQDVGVIQVSGKYGLRNYQALGIPATAKYFNSGVMVINLQKWRQDHIGEQLIDYINNNADVLELHDQDALNAVLFDQWGELDPAWNQQYHVFRFRSWRRSPFLGMKRGWRPSPLSKEVFQRVLSQPYIVHFTYYFKPWTMYFYPYRRSFYRYVDRTAWAGWRRPWWQATLHTFQRRFNRVMDFPRRRLNYLSSYSKRLISKV